MNIGDLEDSVLNLGKEKGKELADNYLGEQQEGGGLTGTAVGFGKDLLDNALGGGEHSNPESGEARSEDNTGGESESSDVNSKDDDNSDDDNNDDKDQDDR